MFELLPELDSAITDTLAKNRWSVTNQILVRCWPYWQDYLEHCEELQKEAAAAGGPSSAAETLSETLRALSGSSSTAEGATAPVADSEETSEASCSTHRMATHADAESASEEEPADSEKAETADNGSSVTHLKRPRKRSQSLRGRLQRKRMRKMIPTRSGAFRV